MASSPASSPLRKKQRLSSPTYEDEFDALDKEAFRTLDEIEYKLSQSQNVTSPSSPSNNLHSRDSHHDNNRPTNMTRNELLYASPSGNMTKKRMSLELFNEHQTIRPVHVPFTCPSGPSPNQGVDYEGPSSPEEHTEKNYEDWFQPSKEDQPAVFSSVFALVKEATDPKHIGPCRESPYKSGSSRKPWTSPHPDTIEAVKKKLESWEQETQDEFVPGEMSNAILPSQTSTMDREPLKNVQNSNLTQAATSPKFAGSSSGSQQPHPISSLKDGPPNPLLARTSAASLAFTLSKPSPKTPDRFLSSLPHTSFSPASQKPRYLGLTSRSPLNPSASRPRFKTPFKTGLSAGETLPISSKLPLGSDNSAHPVPSTPAEPPLNNEPDKTVSKRNNCTMHIASRSTLATCGLVPQTYDREELDAMGVPSALFHLNDISDFLYYRFNPIHSDVPTGTLGADTALEELRRTKHHHATKTWVENHWNLILWKLSGMACLDPEKLTRIWCWKEAMRQLHYRYEREFVGGSRSPLSLITARDTSTARPLVLCVTKISWPLQHGIKNDQSKFAYPEFELTDGWYRIRATVDQSLARAAQRNIIRTGRKLMCICLKLETPRSEPMEILDSYGHASLSLCGNSTHLAAWHSKLGFQRTRCIATMNSLLPDGGRIPIMDIVVTNVYPLGYIEIVSGVDGNVREGPRSESEEAEEEEKWRNRRTQAAMRLQEAMEQRLGRLESYADILERKGSGSFESRLSGSVPSHLETIADDLEETNNAASILQNVLKEDAGPLCMLLRQKCLDERKEAGALIERELETLAPPRRVYSFRILRVKDARTSKKPSTRTAQLTVWDASALQSPSDGIESELRAGQRYLVSNLIPTQHKAWMGSGPGAEIFLSTGRDSKWQLIQ